MNADYLATLRSMTYCPARPAEPLRVSVTTLVTRAKVPGLTRIIRGNQPLLAGFVRARYVSLVDDHYWGIVRHDSIVIEDLVRQGLVTSVALSPRDLLQLSLRAPTRVYVLTRKGDHTWRALEYLGTPAHRRTREPAIFGHLGLPLDVVDPEAELRRRLLEAA